MTTINGVPIAYPVGPGDGTITLLANHIAAAINATTASDPATGMPIKNLITASSTGGVVTIASTRPDAGFSLVCSTSPTTSISPNATETYVAGAEFLGYAAAIAGGFSAGNVLTTTINGIFIPYTVIAGDTTETILAQHIAAAINATATPDPVTGLPLNQLVIASNAGGMVILKASGAALTLSCSLSVGASETYFASGSFAR